MNLFKTTAIRSLPSVCLLLVITCMTSVSFAQGAINLKMESYKEVFVTAEDGTKSTKLEVIDTAVPGDTIVYVTQFTNISDKRVDAGANIKSLIPNNTEFLVNSTECSNCSVKFSVDDRSLPAKASFKGSHELVIVGDNGGTKTATAQDFTLLQWQLHDAIEPAASGSVSYKVKIKRNTLKKTN